MSPPFSLLGLTRQDALTLLHLIASAQYTREICTGDEKEINDALESFPSGHSTVRQESSLLLLSLSLRPELTILISRAGRRRRLLLPLTLPQRPA